MQEGKKVTKITFKIATKTNKTPHLSWMALMRTR